MNLTIKIALGAVAIILTAVYIDAVQQKQAKKHQFSLSKQKKHQSLRGIIIKCCGKESCWGNRKSTLRSNATQKSPSIKNTHKATSKKEFKNSENSPKITSQTATMAETEGQLSKTTQSDVKEEEGEENPESLESETGKPENSETSTTQQLLSYSTLTPTIASTAEEISTTSKNSELLYSSTTTSSSILLSETSSPAPSSGEISATSAGATTGNEVSVSATTENTTLSTTSPTTSPSSTTSTTTTTTTPTTTDPYKCFEGYGKNATLFDQVGNLQNPDRFGSWRVAGDEAMVFGKNIGSWDDNRRWCFQIGMTPLRVTSEAKLKILNSWAPKWTRNFKYWSFGKKLSGVFGFCPSRSDIFGWAENQPNTSIAADCVALNFDLKNKTTYLTNQPCKKKTFFACEGPTTTPAPSTHPIYPSYICKKNPDLFSKQPDEKTDYLNSSESAGIWKSLDGRTYLFSKTTDKLTYLQSLTACCEIGMHLLELHQDFIYNNLVKIMSKNHVEITPGLFWTSGTNNKTKGRFGFPSTKELLPKNAKWASGQPDNSGEKEDCLAVEISSQTYAFKDENCDTKYRYICVAMDTTGTTTGGRRTQRECATIYGINENDLEKLKSAFYFNGSFPDNFLDFMKCMGELTALVNNAKLVDDKFLRMLEAMYEDDDDKLTTGLENYDHCSSLDGANDATRLGNVHKCGVEKEPELVENMMIATDVSTPVKLSPLPSTKAICPEYQCAVNEKLMVAFQKNKLPGMSTACGRRYIYFHDQLVGFTQAAAFCCTYGLKLATMLTIQDFNCLSQLTLGQTGSPLIHLGVSRLGLVPKPRHCTFEAGFNASIFPTWAVVTDAPDKWFLTFVGPPQTPKLLFHGGAAKILCHD